MCERAGRARAFCGVKRRSSALCRRLEMRRQPEMSCAALSDHRERSVDLSLRRKWSCLFFSCLLRSCNP
jgi:hypothetical protein